MFRRRKDKEPGDAPMAAAAAAAGTSSSPGAGAARFSPAARTPTTASAATAPAAARAAARPSGPSLSFPLTLKAAKCPEESLALKNLVFVSEETAAGLLEAVSDFGNFVRVRDFVFTFAEHVRVPAGSIGLSSIQRRFVKLALGEAVEVEPFLPTAEALYLGTLTLEVDFLSRRAGADGSTGFETDTVLRAIERAVSNQYFSLEQRFVSEVEGVNLEFRVVRAEAVDLAALATGRAESVRPQPARGGILHQNTKIILERAPGSALVLRGDVDAGRRSIFDQDWNFESMGIGGLRAEFNTIFRRAFASRVFPPSVIAKLGVQHVKGILLYGPPGTGKTLMARQIGKMLNGKEPKVVNGPEILNKFVGQSEENIRKLFEDAETEYRERGEASDLHIIIFDEIDAICKHRGSTRDATGVADTVVNQLLSKIDGVDSLNNILVIGMTNRIDLLDEALLRAGRLEVHVEIGLPDEAGRLQILNIHTATMRKNGSLAPRVDLDMLARRTKNFTGAEIEELVKAATSSSLYQHIDTSHTLSVELDAEIIVGPEHFEVALEEVRPAYGVMSDDDFRNAMRNGIVAFSEGVPRILAAGAMLVDQVRESARTPMLSVLLEGPPGAGKTAIAAAIAKASNFPYVRLVSPEHFVGVSESMKCSKIVKVFEDAYHCPLSCVVIDDVERLLEYVRVGPRFSNAVLQTLFVLLKREPPHDRKLLVICTTSSKRVLADLEMLDVFAATISIPLVASSEQCATVLRALGALESEEDVLRVAGAFRTALPVKKLIMLTEMARQSPKGSVADTLASSFTGSAAEAVKI